MAQLRLNSNGWWTVMDGTTTMEGNGRLWTARQRLESNGRIDSNGHQLDGDGRRGGTSVDARRDVSGRRDGSSTVMDGAVAPRWR